MSAPASSFMGGVVRDVVQPTGRDGSPPDGRRVRTRHVALALLAVAAYAVTVAAALSSLTTPRVDRAHPVLVVGLVVLARACMALVRSPGLRAVLARWSSPLTALASGWPACAVVLTWSSFDLGIALVLFGFVAVMHVAWLGTGFPFPWAENKPARVIGLAVVVATWLCVLVGPPETALRQVRVRLAAPTLARDAARVRDEPSLAQDMGPFVAYDGEGGRVVGWLIGSGFLGRGPGIVWDPDGVLAGAGQARTRDGYPWALGGSSCEVVIEDWLYCYMR